MTEVINYKCPILNKYYRVYNTSTSVIADVLIKLEDCIPHNPIEIICPMHETISDCFIKISEYNDKRNEIIEGYKEGNGKYNEAKRRLKEENKGEQSIETKLTDDVERLKQQELQNLNIRKNFYVY